MIKRIIILTLIISMMSLVSGEASDKSVEEIQILDFARRPDVIEAMKQFKASFVKVREENGIVDIAQTKTKLAEYYNQQFVKEYENKNKGKSPDVNAMLAQLDEDSIALQYYYIIENESPLGNKHLLDVSVNDKSSWSKHHKVFHPIARDYLLYFGLYDIFLVDADTADVVYSCYKELDFTTNLIDGLYAPSGLGEVFQEVNKSSEKDATMISDMRPYLPSYDAPARFVAAPIYESEQKIGIVIFQLPIGM